MRVEMKSADVESVKMSAKVNEKEKSKSAKAKTAVAGTSKSAGKTKGPYLGSPGLDKAIAEFCRRSNKRQKNSFEMAYEQGDDIRRMISLLEGNKYRHLKRRPNNSDPFEALCGHPECKIQAKQARRYVLFADTVDAIRAAKYEPAILGVSHYIEAARLKSVESIVETLSQVVKDDLSVRELIGIVDQIMPPKKKAKGGDEESSKSGGDVSGDNDASDWKKLLAQIVGMTLTKLAPIAQMMDDQKAKLDKETADSLRKLGEKIQDILRRAE
jgi:hypothetical protein